MDDVNEVLTIGQIRKFKVAELREKLQKLNQPTTGLKPELVNRLFNALFDAQKKADAERLNLLHDPAASFGDTLTPNEQKTSSEQNDKPIVEDDINKNRGEESLTSEGGEGAADNSSTEEENSQDIEMPALIEEDTKVIQSETLTNVRQLQQAENIGQVTNEGRNDSENHNLANESKVEMLPHAANDAAEQSSVNSVDVQKPPGEFQASAEVKSVSNEPLVPTDDISAVSPKTIEKTSHTDEIQNMAENVSVEDAESSQKIQKTAENVSVEDAESSQKIQKTAENVSVEDAESSQTRAKVEVSSVEEQQKLEPEGVPVTIAKENDIAVDSSASDVLPAPVVPENVHCNSEELKAPVQESTEDDAKTKIESTSSKIDELLDVKTDLIVTKAKNEISTLSGSTDTIAESEQSAVNAKDGKKDGTEPQAKEAKAVKPSTIEESSEKTGIKIQPKERKRRWGSSSLAAPSNSTVPIASKGISSDALKELIPDLNKTNTQVSNKTDDTKHKKTTSIRPTIQISTNVSGIAHSNSENSGPMGTPVTPDSRQAPHKLVEIQESGTSKKADSIDGKEVNTEILKPISSSTASGNKSDRVSVDCSKETPSVSPPQNPESNIIFIRNLVRPFTLLQLKEVLGKKGTLVEEKFWIDKIKSKCYVAYETQEQAVAARASLHGLRWPDANPKTLIVDYATEEELSYHLNLEKPALPAPEIPATGEKRPSKDKYDVVVRRDKVDERETSKKVDESQEVRKEKRDDVKGEKRPIREWDREKFLHSKEDQPSSIKRKRSLSPRKESETRNNEKDRPSRDSRGPDKGKKEKEIEQESPANLLDGLFKKTKATPCIYWLPLTEEQAKKRGEDRVEIEKKRNEERLAREAERRTRMGEMGRGRRFSPAYARRDSSPGRGPIRGRNNYQQRRGPPPPRFRGRRGRSASASGKDSRSRSRSLSRSRSRSRKRSASRSLSRSRSPARRTGPKRSRTRSRSRSLRRSPRRR